MPPNISKWVENAVDTEKMSQIVCKDEKRKFFLTDKKVFTEILEPFYFGK